MNTKEILAVTPRQDRCTVLISLVTSAIVLALPLAASASDPHILFFTKSSGFQHPVIRSDNGASSFAQKVLEGLGKKYGFRVTTSKDGTLFDGALDDYDAFFFYTTGDLLTVGRADGSSAMSAKGKKRLLKQIRKQGKGFIGTHSATDTFHSPGPRNRQNAEPDPYIEMIGGEFVTHGQQQRARLRVVDRTFPGIERFGDALEIYDEWYSFKNLSPEIHVLLLQETENMTGKVYQRPDYPATWLRQYGDGRVFYTSMGHGEEVWASEIFQRILTAGILWALRDSEADVSFNLDRVTPEANLPVYP